MSSDWCRMTCLLEQLLRGWDSSWHLPHCQSTRKLLIASIYLSPFPTSNSGLQCSLHTCSKNCFSCAIEVDFHRTPLNSGNPPISGFLYPLPSKLSFIPSPHRLVFLQETRYPPALSISTGLSVSKVWGYRRYPRSAFEQNLWQAPMANFHPHGEPCTSWELRLGAVE